MYQRRIEHLVGPGGLDEYEAWSKEFAEHRKKAKGFAGQSLLQSYAIPNKYTTMLRWETLEDAEAYSRSQGMRDFLNAHQLTGLQTLTPVEGYVPVFDVAPERQVDGEQYLCETFGDLTISTGNAAITQVEARVRSIADAHIQHAKNIGGYRVRRSMGNPFRYLMISFYPDLDSAQAALTNSDMTKSLSGAGLTQLAGGPPVIEHHRVVFRVFV